ncbi:hypothetical protein N7462_004111 [Penicillium macrosclerotiorum]|uniref:uncharacterized protein n=1 Tax=Penicillium macrosclerotiorum TaxID=303699 RepID=UPI002548066B|nr:uncharacterized protein N7462_004111 [Penicillium macrosclerotiorum]KAJ5689719.1 hypothetical protein N7462_004111 [Penicillium macrosclerotiorum]
MADGTDAPVNGKRKLPLFLRSSPGRPIGRRRQSTVHWHRVVRSLLYLLAWIFCVLVVIGNISNKPVLRSTYFFYLDLTNIIPVSVPNAVLINSIARSIGLHDFYQVGLWGFCEGYKDEGITACSKPKALYAFNPVSIILDELLSGASIALPSDISEPLHLAKVASHWMFGLFIAGAVFNFIMIFISPFAVSSRPPQTIKSWMTGTEYTPGETLPHRRRTFIWLRSLPMLVFAFMTALVTIVASVIATVMWIIFANVFTSAAEDLNIKAHVGKQMLAFMWIASGFSLIAFIVQFGSCCASCCGGHKARKQLKAQGINIREKSSARTSGFATPVESRTPHAVTTD